MGKGFIKEIYWPSEEIAEEMGVKPRVFTAKRLLDAGLPDYLHDCLDGNPDIYLASEFLNPSLEYALSKMFASSNKEDVKKGWRQLWQGYKSLNVDGKNASSKKVENQFRSDFLRSVLSSLEFAVTVPEEFLGPFAFMTESQATEVKLSLSRGVRDLGKAFGSDGLTDKDNAMDLLRDCLKGRVTEACDKNPKARDSVWQASMMLAKASFLFREAGIEVHVRDLLESYQNRVNDWEVPIAGTRPNRGNYRARLFAAVLAEDLADLCGRNVPTAVKSFTLAIYDEAPKAPPKRQTI